MLESLRHFPVVLLRGRISLPFVNISFMVYLDYNPENM